jgi:predicted RNA-binding protein
MGKTYWMLVTTQENLDITRSRGFSMQGVDIKNRRKALRIGPEDRVLYYVSDKKGFAATATVTSDNFEDHERIWKHHNDQETFPYRVELSPDVVLEEPEYVDGYQVGPTLEYVKKWPPDLWPLAFFGMLHIIPQRDFNFIESELRRVNGDLPAIEVSEPDPTVSILPSDTSDVSDSLPEISTGKKSFAVTAKSRKSSNRRRNKHHR